MVSLRAQVDPDLWGHLRFGLDSLRDRQLTAVDPYSFTQDVPWINHEWLSEVALALAYRAGGMVGVLLMKAGILAALFAIMARLTRRISGPSRWWILAAALISVTPAAVTIRPQLWTLLGLGLLAWMLWSSRPRLYVLPPLLAVWANLHGGWIVGVGVAGSWIVGRFLDTRSVRAVAWPAATLALATLATVLNPYGFGLWRFLWSTVGISRGISEWRPLWEQGDVSPIVLWVVVWITVLGTARTVGFRAITWTAALPVAWLGILSAFVTRLLPLFDIVALGACAASWKPSEPPTPAPRPLALAVIDSISVLAVGMVFLYPTFRCLPVQGSWAPDLKAAGAFGPASARGRLVLPFDWGEYALWHWSPRLRVSIDGRRETIYSDHVLEVQVAAANGLPAGLEFLDHARPEYVWLRNDLGARTAEWLIGNGYLIDVKTDTSFIARRGDLPPLDPGAPPVSRCFP